MLKLDKYIKPNAQLKRIIQEYLDYEQLVIAVDFDDTLYDFHQDGSTYNQMIELVKQLYEIGCFIVIWTANQDDDFIKTYLKENEIPYNLLNEDPQASLDFWAKRGKIPSRKIFANVYVDDRAGLEQTFKDLEMLIWMVKEKIIIK